jgi:hypothetical protein
VTKEEQFAAAWLRFGDPFTAALSLGFPHGEAIVVARDWPDKIEVICARAELLEQHDEAYFLPTKVDQARKVWDLCLTAPTAEERLKAHKLYAEIQGNLAPKQEQITGQIQQRIIFEMIQPSTVKPAINISPERKQIA